MNHPSVALARFSAADPHRRRFVRLVGGGAVAAALPLLPGCGSEPPSEAVAAWAGPRDEPDLRRWALGYAILSPNSHNRQPWLVDLREPDAITLFVDRERLLPETDPWFRQIVVSQGTFIEALVIALRERGVEPRVQLFPQGEFAPRALDARPVARIAWSGAAAPAGGAAAPAPDPLFAQLLRRHTAKVAYDTSRPVAAGVLKTLEASVADPRAATTAASADGSRGAAGAAGTGIAFGGSVDAARIAPLKQLCIDSARIELITPATVMESLRLTRVGPGEIARHRDGISVNGAFPRFAAAVGLFDRSKPPAEGSAGFDAMISRFVEHANTAMGFVWLSTPFAQDAAAGRTRSAEVEAGRAYMRMQLAATAIGVQVHPMSQAPQEFTAMKPLYERLHRELLGTGPDQRVVQMFCRIGYCAVQPHSPRRGVDAVILKA